MSILFCDNFSVYGGPSTAFMLNGVWAQVTGGDGGSQGTNLKPDPDGIDGGYTLEMNNASEARYALPTLDNTVGVAVRLWQDSLPVQTDGLGREYPCLWFKDGGNNVILELMVTTTGRLRIHGGSTNVDQTTDNPVVAANGWFHLEVKVHADAANGTVEVRVEGATVLLVQNLNIAEVYQVSLAISAYGSGGNLHDYWKDFVVWNGAGAYNNDFLGSVIVALLTPTADVALNWTPTPAGAGYSILDNIPPNDAQFLDAPNPPPAAYVATLSDLSPDTTSVKAVMTMVRAAKTDGGDGQLQTGLISSPAAAPATVLGGANRPITVAQTYWMDVFEVDPKTGAPWLPSAVNNAQLQINRTA